MDKLGFYIVGTTIAFILCLVTLSLHAQEIDILIKNGHVVDARNNIDAIADVSIADGKIVHVGPSVNDKRAKQVIDATGLYVVPGLIDLHTHVFVGPRADKFTNGFNSLSPDDFSFKSGVTTVVDAGTAGWQNFPQFKQQVIDQSRTRILAFLNIAATGLDGAETDSAKGANENPGLNEMDAAKTSALILDYPDIIVGVKIGHFAGESWTPFDRAVEAAAKTNRPLFVECHLPKYSLEDQLSHMRPGDIITHSFENIDERTPIVNAEGKVLPYVKAAKARGILFDVGHGGAGFWFDQAIPAFTQGLWPDSFGTDLHRFSMNAGMKDMLNVMSKFLNIGMPLNDVLARGSWHAARAIKREDLGNLSPGSVADVAILSLRKGTFGFIDAKNNGIKGDRKLEAEMTIRAGKIVWDLNGLAAKPYEKK
jgi:dihydroorotase